jgi:hypothetical protein
MLTKKEIIKKIKNMGYERNSNNDNDYKDLILGIGFYYNNNINFCFLEGIVDDYVYGF